MAVILLTLWGVVMLALARWICGRWFNHLTLYTVLWSATLLGMELRLIAYNHIVIEAWIYIFVAWVALYLGTGIVKLMFPTPAKSDFPQLNMQRLRNAIVLLSLAGLISTVVLARNIVSILNTEGLLSALTEYANQIYGLRFEGEASGAIYLNFLPYAGCLLAGIYTARLGRLKLVALLPMLVMTVDGIISMQRAAMLIAAVFFAFPYILTPKVSKLTLARWQKISIVALMVGCFTAVTGQRGGTPIFVGESDTLVKAGDAVSVLPSFYLYATDSVPCFSEYLKHPEDDGKALWGRYMFASIYRFASRFGFDTYVPYYQHFYYAPLEVNTGTYLREIHRDFGASAIFLFPFTLGALIAFLEARGLGLFSTIVLSLLYVVVMFSIYYNFIGSGGWYFPLPIALIVAANIRVRARKPIDSSRWANSPAPA